MLVDCASHYICVKEYQPDAQWAYPPLIIRRHTMYTTVGTYCSF